MDSIIEGVGRLATVTLCQEPLCSPFLVFFIFFHRRFRKKSLSYHFDRPDLIATLPPMSLCVATERKYLQIWSFLWSQNKIDRLDPLCGIVFNLSSTDSFITDSDQVTLRTHRRTQSE